jgi:flagellar FliJ protein
MPTIPFSLQPVLSYRESLVDMRTRELAHLETMRRQARAHLDALRQARHDAWLVLQQKRVGSVNMVEMAYYGRYLERLEGIIDEAAQHVVTLNERVEAKRQELLDAVEQKKILEKLRDKARQRFLEKLEQADAELQDEMALIQYVRKGQTMMEAQA